MKVHTLASTYRTPQCSPRHRGALKSAIPTPVTHSTVAPPLTNSETSTKYRAQSPLHLDCGTLAANFAFRKFVEASSKQVHSDYRL